MNKTERVANTLESGEVFRYHAAPGVTPNTDAHHSWGVAVLAIHIVEDVSVNLLKGCILHDTGELMTGDVPYTAKMADSVYKRMQQDMEHEAQVENMIPMPELTEREKAILKICDTLEGFIWCANNERPTNFPGMHRGQVHGRWIGAYCRCREKFNDFLSMEEWMRADHVFQSFGGYFPVGFLEERATTAFAHQ